MKFFRGKMFLLVLALSGMGAMAWAQTTDVLGMHSLMPGSGSSITTSGALGCVYCHAPHSGVGGITPLWNQQLSTATYTPYSSSTEANTGSAQPVLGKVSSLCLSCHDGTVALGQSPVWGKTPTSGTWNAIDVFGTTLTGSHPFSLIQPLKDTPDIAASIVATGTTSDTTGAVKLIDGNVECTSCHNPHVQNIDKVAQNFLVLDSVSGNLCLACHDPSRVVNGQINRLSNWPNSIHRIATNQVSQDAHVGPYPTVGANACSSCHQSHDATAPADLLRPATPAAPGMDPVTQDCITCHGGGTYLSPVAPNIMGEMAKTDTHPIPAGSNLHDAGEAALLNNNRHATCTDCHDAHGSAPVTAFGDPPGIRTSQQGARGISASDGTTVLTPAVNQYEVCLRCHGTSLGKQTLSVYGYAPLRLVSAADPLNIIPQFAPTATSSHPVFQPYSGALPQPSLRTYMLNEDGTASTRVIGTQIFCTDCHNSDDNREFGGSGPNGPHGSIYPHILERRYEFSQAAIPGGPVTNTFPNPDLTTTGPYALCAKCHDLSNIVADNSWNEHALHISQYGFSCSVCHTAHGIGATSANLSGERLVDFDVKVVGSNAGAPISYNRSTNTCVLECHQYNHNADGTVTPG